jgi:hypothetical protein
MKYVSYFRLLFLARRITQGTKRALFFSKPAINQHILPKVSEPNIAIIRD